MHLAANRYMERLETRPNGERWISQYWMACTQSSFIRLMVMYPRKVGLGHLKEKDFEGIVHYWRCIGKHDNSPCIDLLLQRRLPLYSLASNQRLRGTFYFDYLAIVKNGIMGNLMTASTCAEYCAKAN